MMIDYRRTITDIWSNLEIESPSSIDSLLPAPPARINGVGLERRMIVLLRKKSLAAPLGL